MGPASPIKDPNNIQLRKPFWTLGGSIQLEIKMKSFEQKESHRIFLLVDY